MPYGCLMIRTIDCLPSGGHLLRKALRKGVPVVLVKHYSASFCSMCASSLVHKGGPRLQLGEQELARVHVHNLRTSA